MNLERLKLRHRRWLVLGLSLLATAAACAFLFPALIAGTADIIDLTAAGLFAIIMFAGGFNFWLFVFGFFLIRNKAGRGASRADLSVVALAKSEASEGRQIPAEPRYEPAISTRTAIVMPIFNEDTDRVYLGIRQTWLSVAQAGLEQHCDFYLLCDTTDPLIQQQEEQIHERLVEEFGATSDFFLIRRKERKHYKAGNVANFLTRHGGAYEFMLVLDADSVMLGDSIKRLILRMQQDQQIAILQTRVLPIRASTLFARSMQFGISRTLPLFAQGQAWFFGHESVYWGHNALVRITPFMQYCNLPIVPGQPPLGGHILSHDIVEAALLCRAGWKVEWDLEAGGSFDELPANLLTYGKRDRRWCQGNFQHFWLIFADRIRSGHRIYFANGIFAYAVSAMLLLLAALGFIQGLRGRVYQYDSLMLASYLTFFLTMLLGPKILGLLHQLRSKTHAQTGCEKGRDPIIHRQTRRKEILSTALEVIISTLFSPALFYLHTRFVFEILIGKQVPWQTQSRNPDDRLAWSTALRLFWLPTLLGILWLPAAVNHTPGFVIYLLPILVGWIISIPVVVATSSSALGALFSKRGFFADAFTPEEKLALGPLCHEQAPPTADTRARQRPRASTAALPIVK